MFIKDIRHSDYFRALDGTTLCELLHPAKTEPELSLRCSVAHARLRRNESSLPHRLKSSAELYYILEGEGLMIIDGESARVHAGQIVYIPPGSVQHIQNVGVQDLAFLCIVDPMWREGDEELVDCR
ncbi:MAG: cupin domain-containing protein [Deltaproteobacteria bacterium]|nr:cupin domain-containing protein [Deltaproteobacteria bacterium]